MFDPSRYRGILVPAAGVLLALGMLDLSLRGATGHSPRWLQPALQPIAWDEIETAGSKISGVVVQNRLSKWAPGTPLGVILGRSTSREGLDPRILEDASEEPRRWLSLYGPHGAVNYIDDLAQLLFLSDLKPDVVILAINPCMLAGFPYLADAPPVGIRSILHALWAGDWKLATNEANTIVVSCPWVFRNQRLIHHHLRSILYQARIHLLKLVGFRIDALFPPDPDPWQVHLLGYPFHASQEVLNLRWNSCHKLGWFEPGSYSPQGLQAVSLARIITNCRIRGARVTIVLMPEATRWRTAIPVEAQRCLAAILREAFAQNSPPVIDLEDSMADEMFCDYLHLNEDGRRETSLLLAHKIERIPNEPDGRP